MDWAPFLAPGPFFTHMLTQHALPISVYTTLSTSHAMLCCVRDVQIKYGMHGVFSYLKLIVNSCIIDNILFTTWLHFFFGLTLSLQ